MAQQKGSFMRGKGTKSFKNILRKLSFHSIGRKWGHSSSGIATKTFRRFDPILVRIFTDESMEVTKKYDFLFSYFVTGFLFYRTSCPSSIHYPGGPSQNGPVVDRLEGFSRMSPVICSWIGSGRGKTIDTLNGSKADLEEIVKTGLIAGTDPHSPGYWGDPRDNDQRICEAADIALSIWFVRDRVWPSLTVEQRKKVIHWLLSVNGKKVYDTNWNLFPVLVNEVAAALGYEQDATSVRAHYSRFKSFYRGDGWFSDGPKHVYDYYNAWGMHYALFWLNRINPRFDSDFIQDASKQFLEKYIYFFSPQGFPIFGRSIGYRMATSAPLIAGCIQNPVLVDAGLARRAFDSLWTHFISKGAVVQGNVTQGYYTKDLRFLDNYSGPASCLWSLRSLVLAFFCPEASPFWTAPLGRLPVEVMDYSITIPSIGWNVTGIKKTQEIIIHTGKQDGGKGRIEPYGFLQKFIGFLTGGAHRPQNQFVKYELPQYSSKEPFCGAGG
jgi:hypothetical protein